MPSKSDLGSKGKESPVRATREQSSRKGTISECDHGIKCEKLSKSAESKLDPAPENSLDSKEMEIFLTLIYNPKVSLLWMKGFDLSVEPPAGFINNNPTLSLTSLLESSRPQELTPELKEILEAVLGYMKEIKGKNNEELTHIAHCVKIFAEMTGVNRPFSQELHRFQRSAQKFLETYKEELMTSFKKNEKVEGLLVVLFKHWEDRDQAETELALRDS